MMSSPQPSPQLTPTPIIGSSEKIKKALAEATAAAGFDINILLLGESGVGKDLFAKKIHELSSRKDRPLIALNCAAIPEELLESEIFGHERGAFTGAVAKKQGKLELADRGILFLDEIGEMSMRAQCKLLRAIEEEKAFERVGGTQTLHVDVRIVAATNADLEKKVQAGTFRNDLYWRLSVFTINIPPLREREVDIQLLFDYYLDILCQKFNKIKPGLSPVLLGRLNNYSWPGNVRELQNRLTQVLICRNGNTNDLDLGDFSFIPARAQFTPRRLDDVQKELVIQTLEATEGNKAEAARILDVDVKSIRNWLGKWGMEKPVIS